MWTLERINLLIEPQHLQRQYSHEIQQPLDELVDNEVSPEIKDFLTKDIIRNPEPYVPSADLIDAVNTALYLRRPLLLEGEPGCGKTRLAYDVAHKLGYPLKACYIRSTSRAQDLLYTYDAIQRLYDLQEKGKEFERDKYIHFGKLGQAIRLAENNIPSVVLIDEIDKADIDFPNDLLLVLDRLEFEIAELDNRRYDAGKNADNNNHLPLILITSNREKELPKPFLRRCLFYYMEFPDANALRDIVQQHFGSKKSPELIESAVERFGQLRNKSNWRKVPGTSELLDWVGTLADADASRIMQATDSELPHLETLVKTQADQKMIKHVNKPT